MCASNCMVFKIRVGRSWFFVLDFFFFFFETYKYAPSSKITQTCLFLSYYSLLIIWHVVQCFWSQTSIKCTRKWRKLLKSETNTETETNFRILPIIFFFGIKNVRVGGKILESVGRSEAHIFLFFFGLKEGLILPVTLQSKKKWNSSSNVLQNLQCLWFRGIFL
jgi:hypothetical protein